MKYVTVVGKMVNVKDGLMKKSTIMKQRKSKKKYDILSKGEVTELSDYNYRLIIKSIKKYSCPNIYKRIFN